MNKEQQIKIFLVGLHTTFTQETILQFFRSKYQNVTRCKLITKMNKSGQYQNTGYGTLFVSDESTYEQIIKKGNFILEGRRFFSKPFMEGDNLQKFKNSIKNRRAFLHNIEPNIDNNMLREIMRGYAQIEDAYIISKRGRNQDPTRPNFGFVMFKDENDAKRLINVKEIHYNGGRFYISEYKNEDERTKEQSPQKEETVIMKQEYPNVTNSGKLALDLRFINGVDEMKKHKLIKEFTEVCFNRFHHHCFCMREVALAPENSKELRRDFFNHLFMNRFDGNRLFWFREFDHSGGNLRLNEPQHRYDEYWTGNDYYHNCNYDYY